MAGEAGSLTGARSTSRVAPMQKKTLQTDANRLKASVQKQKTFTFLRSDAHPLYGLQDWSISKWEGEFEKADKLATKFVRDFLDDELTPENAKELATTVKDRFHHPLKQEEWRFVITFQNDRANGDREVSNTFYMDPSLRSNYVFAREFPLGVEDRILEVESERWQFAIDNSGLADVRHEDNIIVTIAVYVIVGGIIVGGFLYMLYLMVLKEGLWGMENTLPVSSQIGISRASSRGMVASILTSLSFALMVNGSLDKFGKIDPSTSTVLIGMTLGGTFGFVLDNLLGTDGGYREYRWSSQGGMMYAIGALGTDFYARYLITIIFDMFFTVILFKAIYTKVVRIAGFSVPGRSWIANGCSSFIIALLTFLTYANMTRFTWAIPSGMTYENQVENKWISAPMMTLATVTMNMLYLVTETRSSLGEKGINDPAMKLPVTLVTFAGLIGLNMFGTTVQELFPPSVDANATTFPANNTNIPLMDVCFKRSRFGRGLLILMGIIVSCLGFVIFVTSKQTLSGLKEIATGKAPPKVTTDSDRHRGKVALMCIFTTVSFLLLAFFTMVPLYGESGERETSQWEDACFVNYDKAALRLMGLS